MRNQLNRGMGRRVMYVENKDGLIEGVTARIGWVVFSKSGRTVYYRGRALSKGRGVSGNFFDVVTGEEYWLSGIKRRGSNAHPAESGISIEIDPDAVEEYRSIKLA